jgi:hypothetical protein
MGSRTSCISNNDKKSNAQLTDPKRPERRHFILDNNISEKDMIKCTTMHPNI